MPCFLNLVLYYLILSYLILSYLIFLIFCLPAGFWCWDDFKYPRGYPHVWHRSQSRWQKWKKAVQTCQYMRVSKMTICSMPFTLLILLKVSNGSSRYSSSSCWTLSNPLALCHWPAALASHCCCCLEVLDAGLSWECVSKAGVPNRWLRPLEMAEVECLGTALYAVDDWPPVVVIAAFVILNLSIWRCEPQLLTTLGA